MMEPRPKPILVLGRDPLSLRYERCQYLWEWAPIHIVSATLMASQEALWPREIQDEDPHSDPILAPVLRVWIEERCGPAYEPQGKGVLADYFWMTERYKIRFTRIADALAFRDTWGGGVFAEERDPIDLSPPPPVPERYR